MGDALGLRSETNISEIDNDTLIIDDEPSKHKQQGIVADPVYEDTNRLTSELVNQRSIDTIPSPLIQYLNNLSLNPDYENVALSTLIQ